MRQSFTNYWNIRFDYYSVKFDDFIINSIVKCINSKMDKNSCMDLMETENRDDERIIYSGTDANGKTRAVKIKEVLKMETQGANKRPRPPSDSEEEIKKCAGANVNSETGLSGIGQAHVTSGMNSVPRDPLIDAVTSVRTHISRLEAALQGADEAQVRDIIRSMKIDADSSIRESYKAIDRVCLKCDGVTTKNTATQTARTATEAAETEDLKKILEKGTTGEEELQVEELLNLLSSKWPEEFYKMVKGGPEDPVSNLTGDVAVIMDLASASIQYKNKVYKAAPNVKARNSEGKLKSGQLLMDGHLARDLLGED